MLIRLLRMNWVFNMCFKYTENDCYVSRYIIPISKILLNSKVHIEIIFSLNNPKFKEQLHVHIYNFKYYT